MEELVPPSPTSSMSPDAFEKAMADWRFAEAAVAEAEPDSSIDSFGDDRSYSDRSFSDLQSECSEASSDSNKTNIMAGAIWF